MIAQTWTSHKNDSNGGLSLSKLIYVVYVSQLELISNVRDVRNVFVRSVHETYIESTKSCSGFNVR